MCRAAIIAATCFLILPAYAETNNVGEDIARWFDPAKAPFILIPEIDTDPNSGTTIGVFPTVLITNDNHNIRHIFTPDIMYNLYFGYGAGGRVFAFPSNDGQWSITGGAKQRVSGELLIIAEYFNPNKSSHDHATHLPKNCRDHSVSLTTNNSNKSYAIGWHRKIRKPILCLHNFTNQHAGRFHKRS